MPRLIDHAERDREIADAAMRVLGLPPVPPDEGPPDLRW
jgi:hypothetical protein